MKQTINKFSILTIALIFGIGAMTACASAETTTNNKAEVGTAQNNSAANDKKTVVNKTAENKSAENVQTKSIEVFEGREGEVKYGRLTEVDFALVEADVRKKAKENFLKNQTIGSDFDWKEEFKIPDVASGEFV